MSEKALTGTGLFLLSTALLAFCFTFPSFFKIPEKHRFWKSQIQSRDFLFAFLLFLAVFLFIGPAIATLILRPFVESPFTHISPVVQGWYQLIVMVTLLFFLWIQFVCLPRRKVGSALHGWRPYTQNRLINDIFCTGFAWIPSLILVMLVANTLQMLTSGLGYTGEVEQLAVKNLEESLVDQWLFLATAVGVVLIAPLYEELFFRGYLQNWLRGHLGRTRAVVITSLVFACAHFSPTQGAGNVSILGSLFTFSCVLGFLYERQQSLFASILLHASLNLTTTIVIKSMS